MASEHGSVDLVDDETVEYFAKAVLVAALTAALAQVTVPYPLSPAPFTLQTVGVYVAGLVLGPAWAALSLALYLLAGVAGAPVFAGGSAGLGVLTGPTGGYLVSFPVAAAVIGGLVHRRVRPRRLDDVSVALQAGALLVGLAVVYLLGAVWLATATGMSLQRGLVAGALVFVPGDVAKAAVVLGLVAGGYLVRAGD